jgi:hypothetical protein
MRLIHAPTLQLKEFITDIPDYVILSHTWGNEEVTFADFHSPHARRMEGYEKVRRCCEQAVRDGFEWAWVDTTCIDKSSSAELTESLNSMFKWYANAAICYAYLADVTLSPDADKDVLQERFERSRWFTRGWTLQELLAPAVVEFYDSNWTIMGTKSSLLSIIADVTKIHELALQAPAHIALASTAQKFSWAANRQTSREEDIAYCLLGLFNVNMPLLYGEGKRAFRRLQWEIMRTSTDHSIFAWEITDEAAWGSNGLLASSPNDYRNSWNVREQRWPSSSFSLSNRGLQIGLPCIQSEEQPQRVIALLNCYFESSASPRLGRVGVVLDTYGGALYHRVQPLPLVALDFEQAGKAKWKEICIAEDYREPPSVGQKPWVVSLSSMPTFDTRFQVPRLAKCVAEFKDGQFVAIQKPADLAPAALFTFGPEDFAGVLFHDESAAASRSFLLAFGQRSYGMVWLYIQPDVTAARFDTALNNARAETAIDPDLHRDAAEATLPDGTVVAARAKRIRRDNLVGWQILLDTTPPGGDLEADQQAVQRSIDQHLDSMVAAGGLNLSGMGGESAGTVGMGADMGNLPDLEMGDMGGMDLEGE